MARRWRGAKVKSIHVFSADKSGTVIKLGTFKPRRRGGKKIPRWARPFEKETRRTYMAMSRFANEGLKRHQRSNSKKKNGWLKDLSHNTYTANRKATRGLGRVGRVLRMSI
jgi:hypothetical protein